MSPIPFKPKAYLREGCPFSFKFLLFASEAGIRDKLELIRCDPDAPEFEAIRSKLQAGLHAQRVDGAGKRLTESQMAEGSRSRTYQEASGAPSRV